MAFNSLRGYMGHPFDGQFVARSGYMNYYTDVKLNVPVGLNPTGTKFDEAIVNDAKMTVTFYKYLGEHDEYQTTLLLRDVNPPLLWRMYPAFDF